MRHHSALFVLLASLLSVSTVTAQQAVQQAPAMPRDYRGPQTYIPGIFVTPVPNAPFSAKVEIVSQQKLPDGTVNIRTTTNHIARASSGMIYNERRRLVSTAALASTGATGGSNGSKPEPALLSSHIYDPNTRLSIFLNPFTHLAIETILKQPPVAPAHTVPERVAANSPDQGDPLYKEEQLGAQSIGDLPLQGIRKSRTIPAAVSGTGQQVVVVDEYWYSPDLSIYMIVKHEDPRTGEQIVAVSGVERREPAASVFQVPDNYKRVDETPVP